MGGVNLNPRHFQDVPLCDLCFEDALKAGAKKSEELKPGDFKETSIRFCIDGLRNWYSTYTDDYLDSSLYAVLRDISWQWASFCETSLVLTRTRAEFVALRREIAENTSYTDLIDRMKQAARIPEFGYSARRPMTVVLPLEAMGVIARAGDSLGIPFSKFIQVGFGWSLTTNRKGMYGVWAKDIFNPLLSAVMSWADEKAKDLGEVRAILKYRQDNNGKSPNDTAIQRYSDT